MDATCPLIYRAHMKYLMKLQRCLTRLPVIKMSHTKNQSVLQEFPGKVCYACLKLDRWATRAPAQYEWKGRGARGREEGFFQAVEAEARVETRVLCLQAPDREPPIKLVCVKCWLGDIFFL